MRCLEWKWTIMQKENAGKLLGRQLKQRNDSYLIPSIKKVGDRRKKLSFEKTTGTHLKSVVIVRSSKPFSKTNLATPDQDEVWIWLLNMPISQEIVRTSTALMKSEKSPGTDDLHTEYYKMFTDILFPVLTQIHHEAFKSVFDRYI